MSSAARKMMEKYGWKEGQGLGKEREGVKSYVKVVRRDPHTATGLGHAADPSVSGASHTLTTQSVELDAIYDHITKRKPSGNSNQSKRGAPTSSGPDAHLTSAPMEKETQHQHGEYLPDQPKKIRRRSSSDSDKSTSDSESSRDSDDNHPRKNISITAMSDSELFKRCGGVRLGRAGRHRFFDGKLARIEKDNASISSPTHEKETKNV
ncbi:unnamed protein product [Phytomonas sp. Hart1]|nr:unnamed protein product [Phytomonas sp. Hart1]|eukprot:CCW70791.1 unnamed protein product [Phytomonas sp. isolate Hart1]